MISFFLAFVQALLILVLCVYEYKHKSPAMFLWGTLFMMFGMSHLFTVSTQSSPYPDWVLDTASMFVISFCILYLLTRFFIVKTLLPKENYFKPMKPALRDEKVTNIFFIILIIIVTISTYKSIRYSGSLLETSWGDNFTNSSASDAIILWGYFAICGLILYYLLTHNKKRLWLTALLMFFYVVISRNRITILPIFIGFLSYYVYNSKLTLKKVVSLSLAGICVLYVVYGLLVFRHVGSIGSFISSFDLSEFNSTVMSYITDGKGELSLKDVFYYFIYNDNNFANFGKGHTYLRLLFVLVPTELIPGIKPPDFALSMGEAVSPGIAGYSTHPTLFGDCYANLGMYGILLALFWGVFVSFSDMIISKTRSRTCKIFYYSTFSCVFVIIGRGSVYNAVSLMIWSSLIILTLYAFTKRIKSS